MASSASTTSGGDERPRAPHADACAGTAPPQAHVEWAASMQAYYAAGGQPYAWHAAQSVPYPTPEPVAVAEAKIKRKSSGALSGGCTSGRPNLNIGMDLWTDSPVKAETSGQGEINAATHSHHGSTLSMMDERELKRERRKQSNRESARRSRLRKQQECEELAQKVTDLTVVNGTLRSELDELKKACEDMEAENSQLIGELEQSEAPSVVTTLSIQIDTTKAHHRSSDQHGNKNNTGSNG
ncbi:G-box-binding factor 1 [Zea mays]|uniref:G-box-binding factor 1 n=1 Tax=Zea mays TaxID=4577 RepID=A0A1D6L8V2_MAIZE|nr:G-box-binding factor 1 [Zea mays]